MTLRSRYLVAGISLLCAIAPSLQAAVLEGRVVTSTGDAFAGAMVTLWNATHDRKETVYSDAAGAWRLETRFSGAVRLRARGTMYRDFNIDFELPTDAVQQHDLVLEKLVDPQEISDSLTASAHAAALPFPDQRTKDVFISQCSYCHQQGNSLTRRARPESEWNDTIWRMEGYGAYITYGEHKRIRETLFKGFDGRPVTTVQTAPFSPEMSRARIEEWLVGDAMSFLHDTVVGQDGKLYGIDEGKDTIFILDRTTGRIETSVIPAGPDDVVGGRLRGVRLPIGIFTGKHGPHSGAQTSDGRLWITAALSGTLQEFDPVERSWKSHLIAPGFLWRKGIYPHTIRRDRDDNLWFTVTLSNRLVKYDTHSAEFTDYALPHGGILRWMSDAFLGLIMKIVSFFPEKNLHLVLSHHKWLNGGQEVFNWPYGIDLSPIDGSVWYAKLLSSKIGTIDPATGETTEYDTPFRGPRRLRFGPDGMLWIPSFDDGKLMRFDPKTRGFETIDLPVLSPGEYEMPYALNVHPRTGDVWIAANNTDRILRYIPAEKRFIAYPMPDRVIWFRDLEFTEDGKVCSSNANLPAWAHEDKVPAFVCLEPEPGGAYGH